MSTAENRIPERIRRRSITAKVRKRRICRDDRPYVPVIWTIPASLLDATDFDPMWRCDRDYYIARVAVTVGLHFDDDHPASDGTPGGQAIQLNLYRLEAALDVGDWIMATDNVLDVDADTHQDAANVTEGEFNILRLYEGEMVYPSIFQIGSTRPGGVTQITMTLVPVR